MLRCARYFYQGLPDTSFALAVSALITSGLRIPIKRFQWLKLDPARAYG